ncbi:hypothetical protein [Henriciella marina]|uniref:hypothetical protein n=1 Tax=Henriciella marina TaxID=453851 RepID=UPI0012EA7221|nr:hypothetical protein [Henriciella marina]
MSFDLAKHRGVSVAAFDGLIKPEFRKEWRRIHNETYNFLKHADRDPESSIGLHDLPGTNRLLTLLNCQTFSDLFGKLTHHSWLFYIYMAVAERDAGKLLTLTPEVWEFLAQSPDLHNLDYWQSAFLKMPDIEAEYKLDADYSVFN